VRAVQYVACGMFGGKLAWFGWWRVFECNGEWLHYKSIRPTADSFPDL